METEETESEARLELLEEFERRKKVCYNIIPLNYQLSSDL